jgi:hemerythrin-like domain-containing protein
MSGTTARYQLYREHKYVSFALNDLQRLIGRTDFRASQEVANVIHAFDEAMQMLKGHAHYEEERLHPLLKQKNSATFARVQADHEELDGNIAHLKQLLEKIVKSAAPAEQVEVGYQFYLAYMKFVADNLLHLHEEETILLPELQRLYTDAELKVVEAKTYAIMTVEQMVHMLKVLFPHMNPTDRQAFLSDIKECQPEKFAKLWQKINGELASEEREKLVGALHI